MKILASEVAKSINGIVWGNSSAEIKNLSLSYESDENSLTYFTSDKSMNKIKHAKFSVAIVESLAQIDDDRTYIYVSKGIYSVLNLLTDFIASKILIYDNENECTVGNNTLIDETVIIENNTKVGNNCIIRGNTYIGKKVSIGENCIIHPNVTIMDEVIIGDNVIIKSGSVIGGDSFEYGYCDGEYKKIRNIGTVIVGDNVHIGSNTTIDRGTIGNTVIGDGTIIDNLVDIGHEVRIGRNCKICTQCAMAGWCKLEDNVTLYGQVAINNNIVVSEGAIVLAKSGVSKSVKSNDIIFGIPAQNKNKYYREIAFLKKLCKKKGGI